MKNRHWIIATIAACVITAGVAVGLTLALAGPGEPAGPSGDDERHYVQALDAAQPGVTARLGEEGAIALGRQTCRLVHSGGTFREAQHEMVARGFTPAEASAMTYMADSFLCAST